MKVGETNTHVIYKNKDGRLRAYDKNTHKVISYPRILVEKRMGRKLLPDEQVHHKDLDFTNNDDDNLEIALLGEHQKMHAKKITYKNRFAVCPICGCTFILTGEKYKKHLRTARRKDRPNMAGPFCSKHCTGIYGKKIQESKRKK